VNPRPGVLLDVDGTLMDTTYLHTIAWARALADLGHAAPMHAIHRLVGMGGDQLVPELLGRDVEGATDAWRVRYDELRDEATPLDSAHDLVAALHGLGLAVVLATSSPADLVRTVIDRLDIGDLIDGVTTADDVASSKPDPGVFEAAIRAGSIDPGCVLAVGDSVWDVRAARAAGVGCIGLETGGFSRHELAEDGAIAVYRNPSELLAQLLTSPIAILVG